MSVKVINETATVITGLKVFNKQMGFSSSRPTNCDTALNELHVHVYWVWCLLYTPKQCHWVISKMYVVLSTRMTIHKHKVNCITFTIRFCASLYESNRVFSKLLCWFNILHNLIHYEMLPTACTTQTYISSYQVWLMKMMLSYYAINAQ